MRLSKWLTLAGIVALGIIFYTFINDDPEAKTSIKLATSEPDSLDPRLARKLSTTTLLHALYEGLMSHDQNGQLIPAVASSIEVSQDQKTYIFHLRDTQWSNGDPVTSYDFANSWLSMLSPSFPSPNAHQLYVIRNGADYKSGTLPKEKVGIETPNEKTLIVHLEYPIAYFQELVATNFFLPIHSSMLERLGATKTLISNGPYKLTKYKQQFELHLRPNENYWDKRETTPSRIDFLFIDPDTALKMFSRSQIDWVGSPMSILPEEGVASLKQSELYHTSPAAGTHFLRLNTTKGPLKEAELRRALSTAVNREQLAKYTLEERHKQAHSLLPQGWGKPFAVAPGAYAVTDLPTISITYPKAEKTGKIALTLQKQWKEKLGLNLQLNGCESNIYFDKISRGDFEICIGSWYADYRDASNFLELFKYRNNATNRTGWENPQYVELMSQASLERDVETRERIFAKAEKLLLEEAPIIPLFYGCFHYLKSDRIAGITTSELGRLNLKYAYLK